MVMTNSTYDGLCYNVDAIKQTLGDTVDVLHFDEAWYAYANFHEFYDGLSRHLLDAAGAREARDHVRDALDAQAARGAVAGVDAPCAERRDSSQLDMARFNESS